MPLSQLRALLAFVGKSNTCTTLSHTVRGMVMTTRQGARLPSLPLVTFVLLVAGLTMLARDLNDASALLRVRGAAEPKLVSPGVLLALRCAFAAVLAAVHAYDLGVDPGFELNAELWKGSRAAKQGGSRLAGRGKLMMFTNQCYTLQLAYFIGAICCSLDLQDDTPLIERLLPAAAARAAPAAVWIAFEVSLPCACLVSLVFNFVILPAVEAAGGDTSLAFGPLSVLMHNLNLLPMATELLFNDLPLRPSHFSFAVAWGTLHVLVGWVYFFRTGRVLYSFLDPSLPPRRAVAYHAALLGALSVIYLLCAALARAAGVVALAPRVIVVYAGARGLMRLRPRPPQNSGTVAQGAPVQSDDVAAPILVKK